MLIRGSISGYRHLDLGNIKLAFTQVCQEEMFKNVYFAAHSLYFVESGSAVLYNKGCETIVGKGEIVLIKQHSKLDIKKFRDTSGKDFKSIIFYLFPDFVLDFIKQTKQTRLQCDNIPHSIIHLGKHNELKSFCESLLPLFELKQPTRSSIRDRTFSALDHLSKYNAELLDFLVNYSKPVKIDLYEFMIHSAVYNYSVSELARLTGRSLSAFKRDFYSVFETTPHQWLLRRKMEYAEKLLREHDMKASDIYLMLGFNELSYFSSVFKKFRGVAPSQL